MRIDRTRERENEKEKKKKQQSILEKKIFSIMEKSMEAALDKAVDDLLKDWNKEIKIKLYQKREGKDAFKELKLTERSLRVFAMFSGEVKKGKNAVLQPYGKCGDRPF